MSRRANINIGGRPSENSNSDFWNLKDGDVAKLTITASLEEIVSVSQFAVWNVKPAPIWVSTGNDDPGFELGLKPGYKAFVPVLMKDDEGETIRKIWSVGCKIHTDLAEISDMYDGLKDITVIAKRSGAGLKTRYNVMPNPKAKPLKGVDGFTTEDVIDRLGPETREEVIKYITEKTGMSYDRFKEAVLGESDASDDDDAPGVDEMTF